MIGTGQPDKRSKHHRKEMLHKETVLKYIHFFKAQREICMNEISSEFKLKLAQGVYDQTQVQEFLEKIQHNVKYTVLNELDLMTRMNILLLQQILTPESQIKWGLLEDQELLNKIREFEVEQELNVESQKQRSRIDQSNLRELQAENTKLLGQVQELTTQLDQKLENSNAVKSLLGLLERKNTELKALKDKLHQDKLIL